MKLQIITRLTKRESCPLDLDKRTKPINKVINTQSNQISEMINQYYSINTESNTSKQNNEKNITRDFFNQFNTHCQTKYEAVDLKPKEAKRKLEPILLLAKKKHSFIKLETTEPKDIQQQQIQSKAQTCWIGQPKPSHLQLDPKQTYYYQRVQKIKKVSSLVSLDNQRSANSINSTRKPGFIRLNKSIAKKQSSLTKLVLHPSHQEQECSKIGSTMANSRSGSKMQSQINESKQRIAKIRRELNEIYLMRNRVGQPRLKLL